jgi:ubiquinone/menaquinone biosynthesis C-methylase UbiE
MNEHYLSDQEYKSYFIDLGGIRRKIVRDLPLKAGMKVLDLASGYGYFAFEIARSAKDIRITGIDISKTDVMKARKGLTKEYGLKDRMNFLQMDVTKLGFANESFDLVVNFLGFEDIYMTRGTTGIIKAFTEVCRVLKPEKFFSLTVMPPDEMETTAQQLDTELFSYICNAKWLEYKEYIKFLNNTGFSLVSKKNYYTRKKLKSNQAIEEIKFACNNHHRVDLI